MFTIKTLRDNRTKITRQYPMITITLIGLLMPSVALAMPTAIDFGSLDFSSTNQGMWGSGAAPGLNIDRFIGTSWISSASVGGITGRRYTKWVPGPETVLGCVTSIFRRCDKKKIPVTVDTRTGARLDVNTSGRVGFQFGLKADSGSVNTNVQFNADLLVPDATGLGVGDFFNLNPSNTLAGGQLATNFPSISANLDAILGVQASIDNAEVCVVPFGCSAQASLGLGFAEQTFPLLSFNQPDSPGLIKVLGNGDPAGFQFDEPINIKKVLNATIHVPDITTLAGVSGNKLVSSGADNLFTLTADLDALATSALVDYPGGGHVERSAGIITVSADLIDVQAGPVLTIKQNFEYDPSLYVDLSFDNPVLIAGEYKPRVPILGRGPDQCVHILNGNVCFPTVIIKGYEQLELAPQTSWLGRWDQMPDIALLNPETRVTPTFSVQGNLLNNTLLGIDGLFDLNILQANLTLKKFGVNFGLGHVGPLYNYTRQTNLFDTPPLFSQSFGLGGFNTVVGSSFLIKAAAQFQPPLILGTGTSVPEPAPALLLLFGLAAITMSRRKSARGNR